MKGRACMSTWAWLASHCARIYLQLHACPSCAVGWRQEPRQPQTGRAICGPLICSDIVTERTDDARALRE